MKAKLVRNVRQVTGLRSRREPVLRPATAAASYSNSFQAQTVKVTGVAACGPELMCFTTPPPESIPRDGAPWTWSGEFFTVDAPQHGGSLDKTVHAQTLECDPFAEEQECAAGTCSHTFPDVDDLEPDWSLFSAESAEVRTGRRRSCKSFSSSEGVISRGEWLHRQKQLFQYHLCSYLQ